MKSDCIKARNVFNCEAFHLEHINSVAEARQFIKYQVLELGIMYYSKKECSVFGDEIGKENITLSEEEIEICDKLNDECIEVCHRNALTPMLIGERYFFKINKWFEPFSDDFFKSFHITTMSQVKKFANYLENYLQVPCEPSEDFNNYIDIFTGEKQFTKEQAEIGNRLMKESLKVCSAHYEAFPVSAWTQVYVKAKKHLGKTV